jgi:glutathione S-transferase
MVADYAELATAAEIAPRAAAAARPAVEAVTLVQFPLVWGRNVSPFTLKLETWLKLAEIPFTIRSTTNLRKAPRGKLPYIEDGSRAVGDSSLIIDYLKRTRGIDPDAGLNDLERADALAMQRLFEDHFYYILTYSRWLDPEGFAAVGEAFFAGFPGPVRPVGRAFMRYRMRRLLNEQGLGRHTREEIYAFGREDLRAVADYLGDKPFFLGDRLTTLDAVAFGFLANVLLVPVESELKRVAQDFPNLVAWVDAMDVGLNSES